MSKRRITRKELAPVEYKFLLVCDLFAKGALSANCHISRSIATDVFHELHKRVKEYSAQEGVQALSIYDITKDGCKAADAWIEGCSEDDYEGEGEQYYFMKFQAEQAEEYARMHDY